MKNKMKKSLKSICCRMECWRIVGGTLNASELNPSRFNLGLFLYLFMKKTNGENARFYLLNILISLKAVFTIKIPDFDSIVTSIFL